MSDIIMRYEDYLIHTKHASDNTVASYMRDLRQYASYLGSEGVDVLDADQAVVSGYMGSMKAGRHDLPRAGFDQKPVHICDPDPRDRGKPHTEHQDR